MAKFELAIKTDKSTEELNNFINGFLSQKGFARKGKPELNEWRKGFYWKRYMRFTYSPGVLGIKAWIYVPYPGMGSFIKYFMGKAELKRLLKEIQEIFGKGTTLSYVAPEGGAGTGQPRYAGFGKRFGAALIDLLIMMFVFAIFSAVFFLLFRTSNSSTQLLIMYSLVGVVGWLYSAILESSKTQATLGKMALGIAVTDGEAKRISFARATGRYWAKVLTTLTFYIGFVIAAFTTKKQALHDMISGCLVVLK
jgi:uncharacterized RDD family membrane protein YckC